MRSCRAQTKPEVQELSERRVGVKAVGVEATNRTYSATRMRDVVARRSQRMRRRVSLQGRHNSRGYRRSREVTISNVY